MSFNSQLQRMNKHRLMDKVQNEISQPDALIEQSSVQIQKIQLFLWKRHYSILYIIQFVWAHDSNLSDWLR